uniref:Uncharacterized protein n=1 Tax=Arundo donax TaxID=35708 RepID=A0A0A9FFB5_ARUDO
MLCSSGQSVVQFLHENTGRFRKNLFKRRNISKKKYPFLMNKCNMHIFTKGKL